MKVLAMESSNADFQFQQLDKIRMVYEEYDKISKETIPLAERNLKELNEELDQQNQAHDDVIIKCCILLVSGFGTCWLVYILWII